MRTTAGTAKLRYLFEHCTLDTDRRELRCGADLVPIEPQVFDVLEYLIRNRGVHYSPRFGFAYDITGHQNLVLRAGGAIFYDRFQGNEVFDMLTNPPTTISPTNPKPPPFTI